MNEKKIEFIKDELWMLTINAICRGTKLYENGASKERKREFKKELKRYVEKIVEKQYHTEVEEENHKKNIKSICKKAENDFGDILKNGKFMIGRGQKILNLYLKYLWCLEEITNIAEPPHCPIDSKILDSIGSDINWTELDNIKEYQGLIEKIRKKANDKSVSISQWELEKYSRS